MIEVISLIVAVIATIYSNERRHRELLEKKMDQDKKDRYIRKPHISDD